MGQAVVITSACSSEAREFLVYTSSQGIGLLLSQFLRRMQSAGDSEHESGCCTWGLRSMGLVKRLLSVTAVLDSALLEGKLDKAE